jgi:hypothetical protein
MHYGHIFFSEGRYRPGTRAGLWLLAHELAHILQHPGCRDAPLQPDEREALERAANHAADYIVSGAILPVGFAFGVAPAKAILCHNDDPCEGKKISAGDQSIWLPANQAIEQEYAFDAVAAGNGTEIFFGSQFENADVRLPKGVKNKKFGNVLLSKLRGLQRQRRPDIIDFANRVFYEIKTADNAKQGSIQIQSYYDIAEAIRHAEADSTEPPWRREYATWYPDHMLALPGDLTGTFWVCTEATDHTKWPSVILYEVRQLSKRRRKRQPIHEQRVEAFDKSLMRLGKSITKKLKKELQLFDPDYPDYVIIAPKGFFDLDLVKIQIDQYMQQQRRVMQVRPPVAFGALPLPKALSDVLQNITAGDVLLLVVGGVLAGTLIFTAAALAAGTAVVAGEVAVVGAAADVAAVGGVTAAEAAAATGTVGTVATSSTIVAPGYIAAQVAAGTPLAASLQAFVTSSAVKYLAAGAAGTAAFVFFDVQSAAAATPTSPPQLQLQRSAVVRAVCVNDFTSIGGVQTAWSDRPDQGTVDYDDSGLNKHFGVGMQVTYNNESHTIIGRLRLS